jgi:hypothetical protein
MWGWATSALSLTHLPAGGGTEPGKADAGLQGEQIARAPGPVDAHLHGQLLR